jgi:hypothetical protein
MVSKLLARGSFAWVGLAFLACIAHTSSQEAARPVVVKFHEPKTDLVDSAASAPIDPAEHVNIQNSAAMSFGINVDGVKLTFSGGAIRTTFKIDNQTINPIGVAKPLPAPKKGKAKQSFVSNFTRNKLSITQFLDAAPSKPVKPGDKRRLDTVLVRYLIENKDNQPHNIALRVRADTYVRNNDGPLFAAPTMPNQILDGLELKDKALPPYVQVLERPDLKDPGFVAHFTLRMGTKMIGPDRFVCTAHGAADLGWEVSVNKAMGDSDCVMFWSPRVIPPGGKLELGYAYGKGLASTPESEGRLNIAFGGSFEPNKLFTISAFVDDPLSSQTLALELPPGMELLEGKTMQPVPPPAADSATSLVLWKCRVKDLGEHTLRIRSSNGITQTRTVTIARK